MSLSNSTTYTAKVVITESGGARSLGFCVGINGRVPRWRLVASACPATSL